MYDKIWSILTETFILANHNKGENVPIMEIPVYDKRERAEIDIVSNTQVSFSAASNRRSSADVIMEFASPPNLGKIYTIFLS